MTIDYSRCADDAPVGAENAKSIPSGNVHYAFKTKDSPTEPSWWQQNITKELTPDVPKDDVTVCSLLFEVPDDLKPSVFLYYRLSNFYQNHRRYVKSLNLDQLKGKAVGNDTIKGGSCDPLRLADNGKAYYPCGLIANSMFNDTFDAPVHVGGGGSDSDSDENTTYHMTNKGISWASDRDLYKPTEYKWHEVMPPENWHERYRKNYTEDNPPPNLQKDEEFQVWMRTAGLPTFSKLALRNDNETMKAGTYQLNITHRTSP